MSLFSDFIGGAAQSLKTSIDAQMEEVAANKKAEFFAKLQEKYARRAENRDELRQNRAAALAYDRAQIDAEARQRAEEIKQEGLLQRAREAAAAKSAEAALNRASHLDVARIYAGSRGRGKTKQEMDFGFGGNPTLDFIKNLTR